MTTCPSTLARIRIGRQDLPDVLKILGIEVPSKSPFFLTVLAFHVLAALVCVVTGIVAMLSTKAAGRHPRFGTNYYWCLSVVFVTATILAAMRWSEDAYLFFLGAASFFGATLARAARRTDTHHRDGIVLHIDVDRLLFGQRQELAGMEGPPQRDVLAGSRRSWSAPHRARAASIPPVCCRELMRTLKAAGGQGKQSNDG